MDPVYAGAIAGMVLLFGGFVCGLGIYIYKECQGSKIGKAQVYNYEAIV